MSDKVIEDMARYYVQRAATYERVYFKPERQADLRAMEALLPTLFAGREVLEVACGTGWWTAHGARAAKRWLATDLNPETMAVARSKHLPACVAFATVDAYNFSALADQTFDVAAPVRAPPFDATASGRAPPFDAAFAGCWWSHVPLQRLPGWLATLHARLQPGARVVMLDNRYVQTSSTPLTRSDEHGNTYQNRTLDDGSVHEVLKNFPSPDAAIAMLGPRARHAQWTAYEHYWVLAYELA